MTFWPPTCGQCNTQHLNSCEDAEDARTIWRWFSQMASRPSSPTTAMKDVPAALRGPRWRQG
jgi:hypothetical protein